MGGSRGEWKQPVNRAQKKLIKIITENYWQGTRNRGLTKQEIKARHPNKMLERIKLPKITLKSTDRDMMVNVAIKSAQKGTLRVCGSLIY